MGSYALEPDVLVHHGAGANADPGNVESRNKCVTLADDTGLSFVPHLLS
jgi:hypothetical protein